MLSLFYVRLTELQIVPPTYLCIFEINMGYMCCEVELKQRNEIEVCKYITDLV